MIKVEFDEASIEKLAHERYHHPHPMVRKKMDVLCLKSTGMSHGQICQICRISKTTLSVYLKQYRDGGLEGLEQLDYKGQPSALHQYEQTLKAYFEENPPRTIAEAQAVIEEQTGVKRSPTQIRAFLRHLGMRCRKVGAIPGKATDPDKQVEQEVFREKELEPRLAEAKEGKRVVLFMDAAHFVHGAFLGMVWCFVRLFIPSPAGRKRFNVLGALDAVTKQVHTLTNETYINAQSVCELLLKIANHYGSRTITVVLDNARYQKCALVQGFAASLGIELLFLPSYSPNLNLIERFWRFVKKKSLYSTYYPKFTQFKTAIEQRILRAPYEDREELESLLTWNFQSFKKVQISKF
jgi:transposase